MARDRVSLSRTAFEVRIFHRNIILSRLTTTIIVSKPLLMDERKINQAVAFLNHPNVRNVEKDRQIAFLKKKGLSDAEIAEAYERQSSSGTKVEIPADKLPKSVKASEASQLTLRKTNLAELPDLKQYVNITLLNVSFNQLKALPPEIGILRNLTVFNAQQNLITNAGLPTEFFELDSLKDLNLSYNRLTSLDHFNSLTALTKLNVSGNEIAAVPDDIVELQCLEVVLLHNNKLKVVSPCVALLTSLKQIVPVT